MQRGRAAEGRTAWGINPKIPARGMQSKIDG